MVNTKLCSCALGWKKTKDFPRKYVDGWVVRQTNFLLPSSVFTSFNSQLRKMARKFIYTLAALVAACASTSAFQMTMSLDKYRSELAETAKKIAAPGKFPFFNLHVSVCSSLDMVDSSRFVM